MASLRKATFQIQPLTPLWTGDANQACAERILETALLGSMRWWLEACARSVGINVPDPVADPQEYDPDNPDDLDPVSRVFGATGWRRRFRLVARGGNRNPIPREIKIDAPSHFRPRKGMVEDSTWYYGKSRAHKVPAWTGAFELDIIQSSSWNPKYDKTTTELLSDLLLLIARIGTLGPKPQLGLGVIQLLGRTASQEGLISWLDSFKANAPPGGLPSISEMIFGFCDAGTREDDESDSDFWGRTTFRGKAKLRDKFRPKVDTARRLRHQLLGESGERPIRSKVSISLPYQLPETGKWIHRYWAWLPGDLCDSYKQLPGLPPTLPHAVAAHFEDDVIPSLPRKDSLRFIRQTLGVAVP